MKRLLFACISVYFATIFVIFLIRPLAVRVGLVDVPTGRKVHSGVIPLIGGIAILFGLVIGLLTLDISLVHYRALLASAVIMVFVGVLDDFHELTPHARIYVQIFVSFLITMVSGVAVYNLGNLLFFGSISLGLASVPFSIVAIIAVVNAINMMDGMDGLAGSVALVDAIALSLLAFWVGRYNDFIFLLLVISSVIAFLMFNFPMVRSRSKIFMGDAGSMLLGVLLAWFLIDLSQAPHQAAQPVAFLWIMGLPFFDMANVVCRRLRKGTSWVSADREHVHYILKQRGMTDAIVLLILIGSAMVFCLIGLLMTIFHWPEAIMFVLFLVLFVVYHIGCNFFCPIKESAQ